jgi:hypothetical protein
MTDHHFLVAKFRESLEVTNETRHTFLIEKFNLKKLNEVDGKEQYRVAISNTRRFLALESLVAEVDINRAWAIIRENIIISAKDFLGCYELKKRKLIFPRRTLEINR